MAEQLVQVDLLRSGLLDAANPVGSTGSINAAPSFREIPEPIYNGIPEALKQLIGGPSGTVERAGPHRNRRTGYGLQPEWRSRPKPGLSEQDFVIQFGQVIPRPFCVAGPPEYLFVEGPVSLRKTVRLTGTGELTSEFLAHGRLRLTR